MNVSFSTIIMSTFYFLICIQKCNGSRLVWWSVWMKNSDFIKILFKWTLEESSRRHTPGLHLPHPPQPVYSNEKDEVQQPQIFTLLATTHDGYLKNIMPHCNIASYGTYQCVFQAFLLSQSHYWGSFKLSQPFLNKTVSLK